VIGRWPRVLAWFGRASRQGAVTLATLAWMVVVIATPRAAFAQDRRVEAAAKQAMKRAHADFSAAAYDAGLARLVKAARACGTLRCSAPTRAALLRDQGAMQLRRGKPEKASSLFAEALKIDSRLEIPHPYDVADVLDAWNAVVLGSSAEPTPPPTGSVGPPPSPAGRPLAAPSPPPAKPTAVGPAECTDDTQCNGGTCTNGRCSSPEQREESRTNYARVWVGVSLSVDVVFLPSASDVCKLTNQALPANSTGYYCTNPDGSDFPSRANTSENNTLAAGNAGQATSQLVFGDIRLLASIDVALSPNVLLGARFGAVLNGYPGQVAGTNARAFKFPIHAELRGTYVFGKNALAHSGFSPMVFIDGGVAKADAAEGVTVTQNGIPGWLPKTAWLTSGPAFAGIGGGLRYQFSQRIAVAAALKAGVAFGLNAVLPSFGPELAVQYGF
jgi:hypothetical protein